LSKHSVFLYHIERVKTVKMNVWIAVALVATIVYLYDKYYLNYWSRRGIDQTPTTFLFGNVLEILKMKKNFGEFFAGIYNNTKNSRIVGLYFMHRPSLLVNDPDFINDVMIRHFNSFHDRGMSVDEKHNPLNAHLFTLSGQKWRDLRVKLSPTFTSGKLKGMYPTIRDCAKVLQEYLVKNVKNGDDVFYIHDLLARFTTNVISNVAFGIENDCINDRENIFRKMGMKHFESTPKNGLVKVLGFFVPWVFKFIKVKTDPQELEDFFFNVVRQTVEYREASKDHERKDFMQLMVQLKNQGFVKADKNDEENEIDQYFIAEKTSEVKKLTFNQIVAQAFLFFIAGFETSSSTMNFCLFELSKNPDIQKKVQEELDQICKSGDVDDLTYEMLGEMKYLDNCIDETLRKYPIVPILNRAATNDYTFTDTNMTIEKGTPIIIPVLGVQRDPKNFDEPLAFKPERFKNSTHGNPKVSGLAYLPFGDGPRNCIVSDAP
jgi:cytochrome P450 family 6